MASSYDVFTHPIDQILSLCMDEMAYGSIKPDADRFKPLMELPLPSNGREPNRVLGMFAYYAK